MNPGNESAFHSLGPISFCDIIRTQKKIGSGDGGKCRGPIFLSYSYADADWKTAVLTHLSPWRVEIWNDSQIDIGSLWLEQINRALESCSAALLLLSPNYLSSDFIMRNELPQILNAVKTRGLRLLCVHASANSFEATDLAMYQSANSPAQPLNTLAKGGLEIADYSF